MPEELNIINETEDQGFFGKLHETVMFDTRLSLGARSLHAILLYLAWLTRHHGRNYYRGQGHLAERLGIHRSTVMGYMSELEEHGYIAVEKRGQGKPALVTLKPIPRRRKPASWDFLPPDVGKTNI